METRLFDYELPESSIAQRPLALRDDSRLCVLGGDGVQDRTFREFPELVPEGALLVLNDTRVYRARLLGSRAGSGGRVEVFLLRRLEPVSETEEVWLALGRSNSPMRVGTRVEAGAIAVEVVGRDADALLQVRLTAKVPVSEAIATEGHVPLPPYMRRSDDVEDRERYQTVFARHEGSVAAPTAGLHLTEPALARLSARGVEIAHLTLHVGLGTFRPVSTDDLDDHPMHEESFTVGAGLADAVARARQRGAPVCAVGTTVVRALESARDPGDPRRVVPTDGQTRLLIQPGYGFGPVDSLLTNFHMPKSTLLALVGAFAGRERVLSAYAHAVAGGYRFLSYGDAMWIPERLA